MIMRFKLLGLYLLLGFYTFASNPSQTSYSFSDNADANYAIPPLLNFNEVTAHRGNRVKLRENSLSSLINSMDIGATSVEFDVHLTRDNVPVIYHDYYLNPIDFNNLSSKVLIKDLTLAELKSLTFSDRLQTLANDNHLPTFEEFLLAIKYREKQKQKTIPLHLEIKSEKAHLHESANIADLAKQTADVIKKVNIQTPIIARAFNWDVLSEFKKWQPEIPLVLLFDEKDFLNPDVEIIIHKFKPIAVSPQHADITPETIKAWLAYGIKVNPWTVNSIDRAKELIQMGVSGLTTDNPELFLQNFGQNIKAHYCLKPYFQLRR